MTLTGQALLHLLKGHEKLEPNLHMLRRSIERKRPEVQRPGSTRRKHTQEARPAFLFSGDDATQPY